MSVTPEAFEAALRFVTRHYNPVCLQDVMGGCDGRRLPLRPILVTFDDGYASKTKWAARLCSKFGVPAIFFLNAAYLDNTALAPDNLVCYVANVLGMEALVKAARAVKGSETPELNSLADIFGCFLPSISVAQRRVFLETLAEAGGINGGRLAREAGLYLTRNEVRELAAAGFEIGNHTYGHVHCRSLSSEGFSEEIDRNQRELEGISGKRVRSFSVPYGSSKDLTAGLVEHLNASGHEAIFLSESVANGRDSVGAGLRLDRVSIRADREHSLFFEIEVMPRLRAVRNQLVGAPSAANNGTSQLK